MAPTTGSPRSEDIRLFGMGLAWLTVGWLVYQVARPPTAIELLPTASSLLVPSAVRPLLGPVPTFVHALAFSLMLAVLAGPRARLLACAGWAAVEIAFEAAQMVRPTAAIAGIPYLPDYLASGTFDPADVLAAILGCAAAALTLTPTKR